MKTVKLFHGHEWSLSRFTDTKTALRAEEDFNRKAKSENLSMIWNVGTAIVEGIRSSKNNKETIEEWREDAIKKAIEDQIGPLKWLTRFTSRDQYQQQTRCLNRDQRSTYWSIIHDVNQKAKAQGMKNSVSTGPLGDFSMWEGSAIVVVNGYRWKCKSVNGDGVFTKCGKVEL